MTASTEAEGVLRAQPARAGEGFQARVASVGISLQSSCGVRDHARLLALELERERVQCDLHWLQRSAGSLRDTRAQTRRWLGELSAQLEESAPDALLVHYSVFSYAYRGLPVLVRPVFAALRDSGLPVISILHEFAYPWRYHGLRGSVWALTQRAVLREVLASSASGLVTADFRAQWLASRRWLPRRPVIVTPVYSTLPAPSPADRRTAGAPAGREGVIGIFGYGHQGTAVSIVLEALRRLREGGGDVRLRLLGAPGRASGAGDRWLAAARSCGVADAVSFSGELPAQALSDELAGCDVLVFPDLSGPTSRKTTLAASLASGVAVLAFEGPLSWSRLVGSDALQVVRPTSAALAGAIERLLDDEPARRALGARGRAFAAQEMTVASTAAAVRRLLDATRAPRRG